VKRDQAPSLLLPGGHAFQQPDHDVAEGAERLALAAFCGPGLIEIAHFEVGFDLPLGVALDIPATGLRAVANSLTHDRSPV